MRCSNCDMITDGDDWERSPGLKSCSNFMRRDSKNDVLISGCGFAKRGRFVEPFNVNVIKLREFAALSKKADDTCSVLLASRDTCVDAVASRG